MHSLAAASRARMSETEPKWFMFETSSYAFRRRIRRFATLNVNRVNIFVTISYLFLLQIVPLDIHFHYTDNTFFLICIAQLGDQRQRTY